MKILKHKYFFSFFRNEFRFMGKWYWSWSRLKTDRLAQHSTWMSTILRSMQPKGQFSYKYTYSPIYSKLSRLFKAININFWFNNKSKLIKSKLISHNVPQGRKILERETLSHLIVSNTIVWSHFVGIKALCFFL